MKYQSVKSIKFECSHWNGADRPKYSFPFVFPWHLSFHTYTPHILASYMRETHAPGPEEVSDTLVGMEASEGHSPRATILDRPPSFYPHNTTFHRWPYCLSWMRLSLWHVHCLSISKDYPENLKGITFNSFFFKFLLALLWKHKLKKDSYCNNVALKNTIEISPGLLLSLWVLFCFVLCFLVNMLNKYLPNSSFMHDS